MSLLDLLKLLRRKLPLVLGVPLVLLILASAYVVFQADAVEQVTASATVYVQPRIVVDENGNVKSSSTTDNNILTKNVAAFIASDEVSERVADSLGLKDLDDLDIEIEPDGETPRLINITVTADDEDTATEAADALAKAAEGATDLVEDISSVSIMKAATTETVTKPSMAKTLVKYAVVAVVGGLLISITLVVLMDALDIRVRDAAEVEELTGLPVIACVPNEGGEER